MKWKIVADSSCDLADHQLSEENIEFKIAPLKIIVGNNEYVDDNSLDVNEMLNDMAHYKGASTSACPSIGDFIEEFKTAENVFAVVMTSGLSGTYNSACQAKRVIQEEFPNKNIHVIDTKATSGNLIIISKKIKELINLGLEFEEIKSQIDEYNKQLRLLFSLSNFDNLVKNGRMSKIAGIIASTLGIRAVAEATTETGEIKVVEKPRGETNALNRLTAVMGIQKNMNDASVVISHCQNLNAANILKDLIEKTYKIKDITIVPMRGLTSFYAQKQGIIVSF
jgi:DegV family protein with EDD domain